MTICSASIGRAEMGGDHVADRAVQPALVLVAIKQESPIEIMFGRLEDWCRIGTRYDRCPTVFFSAVVFAATVIFWL